MFDLPFSWHPWRSLWAIVWGLSERTGIGLGRLAPWVFEQAMGLKGGRRVGQGDHADQ